jgi:hypothetical protein
MNHPRETAWLGLSGQKFVFFFAAETSVVYRSM